MNDPLDDFDRRSLRSLQPKLIYTQEFSDGLMVLPHDENAAAAASNGDLVDVKDDSLAPLASFDGDEVGSGYVPHQFVLRRSHTPQHQHHSHPHRHRRHHLQLHTEVFIDIKRGYGALGKITNKGTLLKY